MKKEFKYKLRRVVFLYTPIILAYDLVFILFIMR